LITAALPYANGPLHIGHIAGCYLPADIYVRFQKSKGKDAVFICGSDEHGVPISLRAKAENRTAQQIVDVYHEMMKKSFLGLDINFDIYSRTSNKIHHQTAQEFFKTLYDKKVFVEQTTAQLYDEKAKKFLADRYVIGTCNNCGNQKAYGDQCEQCGKTLSPEELINPVSALTGEKPVKKDTTNWFLPLDSMQKDLEIYIDSKEEQWRGNVFGQCKSWLKEGLRPRAMTRDLDWGVPLPIANTEGKVMYVWFDAPIGYISATKELLPNNWEDYWKSEDTEIVHFIGKDNIVFHCIIFPAMLMAEGSYQLPNVVAANEFLNLEGQKISTSRNYAVWVHQYLEDFNDRSDELRYVLCSIAPESKDADFNWSDFQARVNNELVAIFGNLINRVSVLTQKYYQGIVPANKEDTPIENQLWQDLEEQCQEIERNIEAYKFKNALFAWMNLSRIGNKYLADQEPWKTIKTDENRTAQVMHNAINVSGLIASYAQLFIPKTSAVLAKHLGLKEGHLTFAKTLINAGDKIETIPLLFAQITDEEIAAQQQKLSPLTKTNTPSKPMIDYEDFTKLNIVAATISNASKVENADKLLKITLSLSEGAEKTVLSGIAEHYGAEEIIGKQVTYLANLAPRKIRGVLSEGMILLAESNGKLVFVSPENKVEDGSEIA